jgi:hypothetical protein
LTKDLSSSSLTGPSVAPARGSGRPATVLTLDPAAGGVVGIDFGHDGVRVGVADLSCTLLTERRYELDVDDEAGAPLDAAAEMANAAIAEAGLEPARIAGVGVALSAPVGSRSRRLAWPTVFPGWFGLDVEQELSRRLPARPGVRPSPHDHRARARPRPTRRPTDAGRDRGRDPATGSL